MHIVATNLKATIADVEYLWLGKFGAVLESRERGVKVGDTRVIGTVLFFANWVQLGCWPWRPRIAWRPLEVSEEWMAEFKRKMFA